MNKWLMSVLLCISMFFVFGCSDSNIGAEPEIEEVDYEEVDNIEDLDLDDEDLNDEDINEEDIEVEVDEEPAEQN